MRMPVDERAFAWHSTYQRGVLSRSQAVACGFSLDALRHRLRPGGPWQRLLPGVYLTATGQPTREQLLIASMVYTAPHGLITGPAALANYRVRGPQARVVDVLVPAASKRSGSGFVVEHRTWRIPKEVICDGPIRYAPAGRAVADTVRALAGSDLAGVRAIVAGAVQQGRCTIADLAAELQSGPVRGSATLRAVLAEVIGRDPVPGRGRSAGPDPLLRAAPAALQPEAVPAWRGVPGSARRVVARLRRRR